eukprot:scaffold921_cov101-Isochrysis_galbana.AAC.11
MACSSRVPAPARRWTDWTDPPPPGRTNRNVRQPAEWPRTCTMQPAPILDGCENKSSPVVDHSRADRQSAGSLNL